MPISDLTISRPTRGRGLSVEFWIDRGVPVVDGLARLTEAEFARLCPNAQVRVHATCDHCGEAFTALVVNLTRHGDGLALCRACRMKASMRARFGVDNVSQTPGFGERVVATARARGSYARGVEKFRETCMNRYGVDHPMKDPEVFERAQASLKARFPGGFGDGRLRAKRRATLEERLGVDNPAKAQVAKDHARATCLARYGVDHPMRDPTVRAKVEATDRANHGGLRAMQTQATKERVLRGILAGRGAIPTSRAQRALCAALGARLNLLVPGTGAVVDCALAGVRVAVEYDGGGHDLSVALGQLTAAEFAARERARTARLLAAGWRVVRVVDPRDRIDVHGLAGPVHLAAAVGAPEVRLIVGDDGLAERAELVAGDVEVHLQPAVLVQMAWWTVLEE